MNDKLEKIRNFSKEEIRQIREDFALSQGDLAKLLKVCQGSMSAYERGHKPIGKRARIALHNLIKNI